MVKLRTVEEIGKMAVEKGKLIQEQYYEYINKQLERHCTKEVIELYKWIHLNERVADVPKWVLDLAVADLARAGWYTKVKSYQIEVSRSPLIEPERLRWYQRGFWYY